MSIKAISLVQERSRAKGSNLLVLIWIADSAKDDGRSGWPSAATLAWKSRMTERAAEIILRRLVTDGEIAPEWHPAEHRLYLHIRCAYDWAAYQREGPPLHRENISGSKRRVRESFARSLVAAAAKRAALTERLCSLSEPLCTLPEYPCTKTAASRSLVEGSRSDPSGSVNDPSVQKVQGLAPHFPFDPDPKTPEACAAVITRLVHDTFDLVGVPHAGERVDFEGLVKERCAELHIPYTSTIVGQAIESALVQRARVRALEGAHATRH